MSRIGWSLALGALLLAACSESTDRTGRLLSMAAQEAANIPSTLERFTRQLNIADTQLRTGRTEDAAKTLMLARDTLANSQDEMFDSFRRIAGWTSIAQLAYEAKDRELALKSADNALTELNKVMPVADRAQYVLSLAGEIERLKGKPDAIELLNSGAGWAAQIAEAKVRRTALTAIAYRLVSLDAYEVARNALNQDTDPVWRTDTFLAMANSYAGYYPTGAAMAGGGGRGGAAAGALNASQSMESISTYGKDVRFEANFKR